MGAFKPSSKSLSPKASLLEDALRLAGAIRRVEAELVALPPHVSEHWLWLGNVKRAGYIMDQVVEVLQEASSDHMTERRGEVHGGDPAVADGAAA